MGRGGPKRTAMRTELSGRRRRRTSSVLQLMLPIIAGLCVAHISSPDLAVAFVLAPPTASWAGLSSQLHSWGNEAPSPVTSTAGYRAHARMVLSESPSAACRRALRRARRPPSPAGVSHEQVRGHLSSYRPPIAAFTWKIFYHELVLFSHLCLT